MGSWGTLLRNTQRMKMQHSTILDGLVLVIIGKLKIFYILIRFSSKISFPCMSKLLKPFWQLCWWSSSLMPDGQGSNLNQFCYISCLNNKRTHTCVQSDSPRRWCSHQFRGSAPRCAVFPWFWCPRTRMHPGRIPAAGCIEGWRGPHSPPTEDRQWWVQGICNVLNVECILSLYSNVKCLEYALKRSHYVIWVCFYLSFIVLWSIFVHIKGLQSSRVEPLLP